MVAALGQHSSCGWACDSFTYQTCSIGNARRLIALDSIRANGRAVFGLFAFDRFFWELDFLGIGDSRRREFVPAPLARFGT